MNNSFVSSGAPPGSARPPGTSMRPGSNRAAVVGVGSSLNQPIAVTAKPGVIREGVRGASRRGPGTSAGPGRQVIDRSYYIGLLRPKIAELSTEIERLNEQEQLIDKNGSVLVQLQQKIRTLQESIDGHKNHLADVNLAIESAETRDVASMRRENSQLAQSNTERRKAVDKLFLSLKEAEAGITESRRVLESELEGLDRRLVGDSVELAAYKEVRREAFAVAQRVLECQHEVQMLGAKQELLMARLEKDGSRRRAAELLREILRKRRARESLAKECALSVEAERAQLLKTAKATRSDIEALGRQITDTRDAVEEAQARVTSLDEELKNYTSDNVKAYQALKTKDAEMQTFLDDYPDQERQALAKIEADQNQIKTLLERISRALELQQQLPAGANPGVLQDLATEVGAKQEQIKNDQRTYQRLEKELLERKAELDKVSHLDHKIKEELESQTAKIAEQRAEIERYEDLDGLRREVDTLRADLEEQLSGLKKLREHGTQLTHSAVVAYEAAAAQLQAHQVHQSLMTQEQKLRMLGQSSYSLEDFVRLKEKEMEYGPVKTECLRTVDELNLMLKEPARIAGNPGPPMINLSG